MFCKNCGKQIDEEAKFCPNCGRGIADNRSNDENNSEKEVIIIECKGSLQGGGTGKIILTNKNIIWSKSKANFIMGGILALATKGNTTICLNQILKTDTYFFLGGAGLKLLLKNGKSCRLGFNASKDRDKAMEYINTYIKGGSD